MINFFDHLYTYTAVKNQNKILIKIRIYSLLRFLIRIFTNAALPLYFYITRNNPNYKLLDNSENSGRYIVSLTSFPARIKRV